jgi:hypothetical protein
VGIEAAVRPHGELPAGSRLANPPDRLAQEVGGAPDGVGPALAQTRHQHVARPCGDREEGVVAADAGVAVVEGTFLGEAVRLADRRVEIDREGCISGSGSGRPGPGEEVAADGVELADVAPAEAAQERAQGRGCLDRATEDPGRPTGAKGVCVVDAVTTRERGHHEREELVADVRSTGRGTEVQVLIDEVAQAEVLGQGGRQEEPRVGHQAVVVEGGFQPVEGVG